MSSIANLFKEKYQTVQKEQRQGRDGETVPRRGWVGVLPWPHCGPTSLCFSAAPGAAPPHKGAGDLPPACGGHPEDGHTASAPHPSGTSLRHGLGGSSEAPPGGLSPRCPRGTPTPMNSFVKEHACLPPARLPSAAAPGLWIRPLWLR